MHKHNPSITEDNYNYHKKSKQSSKKKDNRKLTRLKNSVKYAEVVAPIFSRGNLAFQFLKNNIKFIYIYLQSHC